MGHVSRPLFSPSGGGAPVACFALAGIQLSSLPVPNGNAENGAGTEWSGGAYSVAYIHAGARSYASLAIAAATIDYTFPAGEQFTYGRRYVADLWRRLSVDHDRSTLRLGVPGVDDAAQAFVGLAGDDPVDLWLETVVGADGGVWKRGRVCWTPSANRIGVRLRFESTSFAPGDHAVDDLVLYVAAA